MSGGDALAPFSASCQCVFDLASGRAACKICIWPCLGNALICRESCWQQRSCQHVSRICWTPPTVERMAQAEALAMLAAEWLQAEIAWLGLLAPVTGLPSGADQLMDKRERGGDAGGPTQHRVRGRRWTLGTL